MLKKKMLIIGGTGFIGYHLAQEATRRNWTVHSLSKKKPKNIRKLFLLCKIHLRRHFKN